MCLLYVYNYYYSSWHKRFWSEYSQSSSEDFVYQHFFIFFFLIVIWIHIGQLTVQYTVVIIVAWNIHTIIASKSYTQLRDILLPIRIPHAVQQSVLRLRAQEKVDHAIKPPGKIPEWPPLLPIETVRYNPPLGHRHSCCPKTGLKSDIY